jgi:hypothetical protein
VERSTVERSTPDPARMHVLITALPSTFLHRWGSTPDPATAPVPVGGTIPRSPALAPTAAPAAVTYVTPA